MKLTTEMNLSDEILSEGKTIVKFFADFCAPCKMMSSILDEVNKSDGIKIIDIDTAEFPTLVSKYGVTSVPALIFYENEKCIGSFTGAMPASNIRNAFNGDFKLAECKCD